VTPTNLDYRSLFAEDGRCCIVAMDHGAFTGPQPGWINPQKTLEAVLDANPDAIITTIGILNRYNDLIKKSQAAVILTIPLMDDPLKVLELSSKMGIAGIKLFLSPTGASDDSINFARFLKATMIAHSYCITVVGEMYPVKSEKITNPTDKAIVAKYARIGMEHGADVIKTFYTGSEESFREVVESCPVPVVILGGEKVENDEALLESIGEAIRAGAAGAAIGRNVWQHKDPKRITTSIMKIVHGTS
jgi:DhnA family fructose-bisphosphate aldolase class Ia